MIQPRTFVIRRSFVAPVGLLIVLMVALSVVCIVQGQATAKAVIPVVLLVPVVAFFVESAFRRLVFADDGITAIRPFRKQQILFADVTGLETVRVRSRVFMTLEAGPDNFLIISNSYGNFAGLVTALVAAVPDGTVTEETQRLAKQPVLRHADIFTAWFAVIALIYILIAQFKG